MAEQGAESGIVVVEVSAEHELEADRVDALVDVKASAFFTGTAALTNAKEVAALVRRLEELGVPRTAISLDAVQAELSEGLLSRSSSATYSLRIHLRDLERLGDVLGAFTGLKQATLRELRWGYGREAEAKEEWMQQLAQVAVRKVRRVAEGLGVRLAGLHRFTEKVTEFQGAGFRGSYEPVPPAGSSMARASYGGGMGFTVAHRKKVRVEASAEFRTTPASAS